MRAKTLKKAAAALVMSLAFCALAAPVAYADVTTHLFDDTAYQQPISGKSSELSFQDYLNEEGNNLDLCFVDSAGKELPVTVEKIDDSIGGGNICVYTSRGKEYQVPVFGAAAYVLKVCVPRSDEYAVLYADNFVEGTTYDDLKNCSNYDECEGRVAITIYSGLATNVSTKGSYGNIVSKLDSEHPLVGENLKSDLTKYVYELSAAETVSEEFFNDMYAYKLPVDNRTSFDQSYMLTSHNNTISDEAKSRYTAAYHDQWRSFIYFTYAEDKDAADKIAALPAAADVTLADVEAIEAARAAYDKLAQWEGAQDAIDATKLTEAEAALAPLVEAANQEAADGATAAIAAIGEVTADSKDAIAAARAAYDALTDDQKELVSDEDLEKLEAAEAAYVTAVEKALATAKADLAAARTSATTDAKTIESLKGEVTKAKAEVQAAKSVAAGLKASKFTVKAKTVKAKAKKKTKVKAKKAFTVKGKAGKVTYAKLSGNAKISISAKGKVTVKKGLKKGKTYKVKVLIVDAGSKKVAAAAKTVTLKVKVK